MPPSSPSPFIRPFQGSSSGLGAVPSRYLAQALKMARNPNNLWVKAAGGGLAAAGLRLRGNASRPAHPRHPHFTQKKTLKSLGPPAKPGHKAALKRIQVWREMGGKGFLSGTSSSASKEIIARHERADDAGQMNLGNKAPGASWGDVRSQQQWLPRVRATRSRLSGRGDEAGARQTPAVPPQLLVPRAQPRPRGAQRAPGTLGTGKAAAAKSCGWPERVAESWGASEEVTE